MHSITASKSFFEPLKSVVRVREQTFVRLPSRSLTLTLGARRDARAHQTSQRHALLVSLRTADTCAGHLSPKPELIIRRFRPCRRRGRHSKACERKIVIKVLANGDEARALHISIDELLLRWQAKRGAAGVETN